MQKLLALSIGFVFLVLNSFAQKQNGIIRGTVTSSDGKAAEAVSVLIKGRTRGTLTDEKGHFEFRRLHVIRIASEGRVPPSGVG